MGIYICIHMASKNISITEDVYNKLLKIKRKDESFSELFLRLLKIQNVRFEECFGAWNFSKEEEKEIWTDITKRSGRNWKKPNMVK